MSPQALKIASWSAVFEQIRRTASGPPGSRTAVASRSKLGDDGAGFGLQAESRKSSAAKSPERVILVPSQEEALRRRREDRRQPLVAPVLAAVGQHLRDHVRPVGERELQDRRLEI